MLDRIYFFVCFNVVVARIYYHESSYVLIKPNPSQEYNTFGYSLAYQNGSSKYLVTGAPHSGSVGKVFRCPMDGILDNKTTYCDDVDMKVDELAPYSSDLSRDIKFNLGLSVSSTPDYFLTCAPLWTTHVPGYTYFSYGTCFIYNGTSHRYQGVLEQYLNDKNSFSMPAALLCNITSIAIAFSLSISVLPLLVWFWKRHRELYRRGNGYTLIVKLKAIAIDVRLHNKGAGIHSVYGGTGSRTFVDLSNDLIIISKMVENVDILCLEASNPLASAQVLTARLSPKNQDYLAEFRNFGYAIASGNFFDVNTYYAFSASKSRDEINYIHFLKYSNKKIYLMNHHGSKISLYDNDEVISSMFGAAMFGADLNQDGLSELLVGAPGRDDKEGGYETGAVYIFLGGDMTKINEASRRRLIVGDKDGSRFGSTIAATDIDGDNLPEIFVSAPYENFGLGAVYILSGFEINEKLLKHQYSKKILLSELKLSQRIQKQEFETLGYSLQIIPDMNDNGCDELAIGSPGSNSILLLRCMPAATVTVNATLLGDTQIVREQDTQFEIRICVNVTHSKGKRFYANFLVNNEVIGNDAYIDANHRNFEIVVLGVIANTTCGIVIVNMIDNQQGKYRFTTKFKMNDKAVLKSTDFLSEWVTPSLNSSMDSTLEVSRHCVEKDCEPDLFLEVSSSTSNDSYIAGSSKSVTLNLLVRNSGNSSFDSCLKVHVSGASVAQTDCFDKNDHYVCELPSPFKRNKQYQFYLKFNMMHLISTHTKLEVHAYLHENCKKPYKNVTLWQLNYHFNIDDVDILGTSHNQTVSDIEIQDINTVAMKNAHEYLIINQGPVNWKSLKAVITIDKESFKDSYRVTDTMLSKCEEVDFGRQVTFTCPFDLSSQSTVKLIASTVLLKNKLMDYLHNGKLYANSTCTVIFGPDLKNKTLSLSTEIKLAKDWTIGQNMTLIIFLAALGAVIALAVVIFILYKMEFFKRKEKTKLDQLKKLRLRRQGAIRRPITMTEDETVSIIDDNVSTSNMDMEVVDDCPFEIIEVNERVLIEETENNEEKETETKKKME